MSELKFTFQGKWKEELVCACQAGSLVLEMPMGAISVVLPSQAQWQRKAPEWAKEHWASLHAQLHEWCAEHKFPLYVEDTAHVW